MRITLTFDSETAHTQCHVGWGFSAYLHEAKLLFDTGEDPHKLEQNLEILGIRDTDIERVVLSHGHFDHVRGLMALKAAQPQVIVAPGLLDSRFHRRLLREGFMVTHGNGTESDLPGVKRICVSQNGIVEQTLVIRGERGWCALFGCAHWGVDRWIRAITTEIGRPLDLVMGGYHLLDERTRRIQEVIDKLVAMGVRRVAPCHCTGRRARRYLKEAFGEGLLDLRVGDHVEI
jgi:7,8-dihydropterin-6-yl-methyl-4-(beta-D-ribofuranosyl)aminobenzene 5'-phosphate synthase